MKYVYRNPPNVYLSVLCEQGSNYELGQELELCQSPSKIHPRHSLFL